MESTQAEVAVTTVSATAKPREITARALIFGCVAGALLSAGNVYTGLKTGWADGGGIATATAPTPSTRRYRPPTAPPTGGYLEK